MSQLMSHLPANRRILAISFSCGVAVILAMLTVLACLAPTVDASSYTVTLTGVGGNWTSAPWVCTPGPPGSATCTSYPGQGGVDGDLASLIGLGGGIISVNSSIGNAVTLSVNGAGKSVLVSAGGTLTLTAASVLNNTGDISIAGGTLTNNGNLGVNSGSTISFSNGTFSGSGTTNISGAAPAGTLNLTGTLGPMTISGQTINSAGNISYSSTTSPVSIDNGAVINNNGSGLFVISTDQPIASNLAGAPTINNSATFRKNGGAGTTNVQTIFNNAATGTVDPATAAVSFAFQSGGTHTGFFSGNGLPVTYDFGAAVGQTTFNNGASFGGLGGVKFSSGQVNVNTFLSLSSDLTNAATITFGPGTTTQQMNVGGNFIQTPTGVLNVKLNGTTSGSQYDFIQNVGTATLAGTLNAFLGFTPLNGTSFNVLTYTSHAGTFNYTPVPYPGGQIIANYNAGSPGLVLVAAPVVDISLLKAGPGSVFHNSTATYTVKVGNGSPTTTATNVVITDNFSSGTFNPALSSAGCSLSSPGVVACSIPALAPSSSINLSIAIDATTIGSISDFAQLSSVTETDSNPANNTSGTITTTVNPSTDLSVSKTGTPDPVLAGSLLTYSINVTNGGPDPISNFTAVDQLPVGSVYSDSTGLGWSCGSPVGQIITCNYSGTPVAVGPAPTLTIHVLAPSAAGSITNQVQVSAPTDPNGSNNNASVTTTVAGAADLGITKTGPASVVAGSTVTYVITVTNNGPSDVSTVTVNDTPGAGLTFSSNAAPCTTGFPCTFPLAATASISFNSNWAVSSSATGTVVNNADVSVPVGITDANAANNTASSSATVTTNADVQIVKTGPATAIPGGPIYYPITVTNNGPSDALSVVVDDPTPPGLTVSSISGGGCSSFPCTLGTLTAGQVVSMMADYDISPSATGTVTNTATVSSPTDTTPGNDSSTVTTTLTPQADLSITKTGPAVLPASGPITFTITVKNLGPSDASGVVVKDTPTRMTYTSAGAPCSTSGFPCPVGTIPAGGTLTITADYTPTGNPTTVINTADVTSTTSDPNFSNNSSSVTVGNGCPAAPVIRMPQNAQTGVPTDSTMQWTGVGATRYDVYLGPLGTGCNTFVSSVTGTTYNFTGLMQNATYEARVVASKNGCPAASSICISFSTGQGGCNLPAPQLLSPQNGATAGSPLTLQWSSVASATSYHVVVTVNGNSAADLMTSDTTATVNVDNGPATWSVTAIAGNCSSTSTASFDVCGPPPAPLAAVVGAPTTGEVYTFLDLSPSTLKVRYDFQESTSSDFSNAQTQTTTSPALDYKHDAPTVPLVFFYRMRAYSACSPTPSAFSRTVRVVVLPKSVNLHRPTVNVPAGNRDLIVQQVFIPGDAEAEMFSAVGDRPWIVKIEPSSGILPPEGISLFVSLDPAQLPNGTFTATVIVTTSPLTTANGRIIVNGTSKSSPVTINLVTPVAPVDPDAPTSDSVFLAAVGHLDGLNSQWRSNVHIYNPSPMTLKYILNFTPNGSTEVKRTTIETPSGETTALDDIIHNWYGFGAVGDSSTGVLEVRPIRPDGTPASQSLMPTVSSRTFNATGDGSVGQFIPGEAFTQFIGTGFRKSMQQIAQSTAYRTNFAVVEGSGSPASILLSMFNSSGSKLFDLPVNIGPGEQKLLNGLLAAQGVSVADGRMEVSVTSGNGKVTAYASVIDNTSLDPQFVPGTTLGLATAKLYVLPGVADLNSGGANWRTDMRMFNSGPTQQTATLTFYPLNNGGAPLSTTVTVVPNEVKVIDSVLPSLFATHDTGGAVHITTAGDSSLVITDRTYNQTTNGTLGQFVRASTAADGVANGGRALNILQVEDSSRFRTNLGVTEMTGKPATVEISLILPDSKVTPSIQVPLGANEFRQFSVGQFGLGNLYNARVSVQVIDGDGVVTAYGSVIDQLTTDPIYVVAQ